MSARVSLVSFPSRMRWSSPHNIGGAELGALDEALSRRNSTLESRARHSLDTARSRNWVTGGSCISTFSSTSFGRRLHNELFIDLELLLRDSVDPCCSCKLPSSIHRFIWTFGTLAISRSDRSTTDGQLWPRILSVIDDFTLRTMWCGLDDDAVDAEKFQPTECTHS